MFDFTHTDPKYALNTVKWKGITEKSKKFFSNFPFYSDKKFKKLTKKKQRFILGYTLKDIKGFFLYDCYRFANQTPDMKKLCAAVGANHMINDPEIKQFLEQIDWMRVESMGYNAQRIIEEESSIAYSDITKYLDEDGLCPVKNLKELPPNIRRAIKSFEIVESVIKGRGDEGDEIVKKYKLKLWDKGASLNRLQRVKGMHKDNLNITGGQTNLNIQADMSAQDAAKLYAQFIKGEK